MKLVRFTRGFPPYNGGEVAGFEDDRAVQLAQAGAGDLVEAIRDSQGRLTGYRALKTPPVDRAMKGAPVAESVEGEQAEIARANLSRPQSAQGGKK